MAEANFGNKRIMVVDDYEFSRELLQEIIKETGCDVDGASSGKEAISLLDTGKYDLVFMDIVMPEKDGYAITKDIREHEKSGSHIPIIAVTANAEEADKERCIDSGMDDYVTKPIKVEDIRELLEKYLQ